mmetsp:Transcript_31249/g.51002  ORF Transcript_31249/g.51002 Transcript_31249/m.51002 type:complete len:200 (-) Transcript_31249:523-1122(-)
MEGDVVPSSMMCVPAGSCSWLTHQSSAVSAWLCTETLPCTDEPFSSSFLSSGATNARSATDSTTASLLIDSAEPRLLSAFLSGKGLERRPCDSLDKMSMLTTASRCCRMMVCTRKMSTLIAESTNPTQQAVSSMLGCLSWPPLRPAAPDLLAVSCNAARDVGRAARCAAKKIRMDTVHPICIMLSHLSAYGCKNVMSSK